MKNRPLITLLILLSLLSAAPPAQAAQAMPTEPATPADLLQFTSGGHALGFSAGGVYAAAGDHALHVAFAGANAVPPQADGGKVGAGDQAAPLGRVVYENLWDGITLVYSAAGGSIYTSTYTLAPGADPAAIRLEYNAAPAVNGDGSLGIAFTSGALTESAPIAWQEIDGRRVSVDASFRVDGEEVAFALGPYDPAHGMTIDPSLSWNAFLGGSGDDWGSAIAVDGSGNVYVTGSSNATWGSPVRAYTGGWDTFAAKLNPYGALVWNTFLGGSGADYGYGVSVDGSGNVYVMGTSDATWGSPIRAYSGNGDAFLAKLTSTGSLSWNSFLGGSGSNEGFGITMDGSGNIYLIGDGYYSWESPVRDYTALLDAFVVKLTSSGAIVWNTFLGGSGYDRGTSIAVDGSGNVYVTGTSDATWGSPARAHAGGSDVFVAELTSSGGLSWNTFLGGGSNDYGKGIAVSGNYVFVTGYSIGTWGSPVRAFDGYADAFVANLYSYGALRWNTFLGGSGSDYGYGIDVDTAGNIYIAGYSSATWGSPGRAFAGSTDAFAAKLDYNSGALASNTFLGGSDADQGQGIVFSGIGTYVVGYSAAAWGSPLRSYAGGNDAFVAGVNLPHACPLEAMELFDLTGDCRTDVGVYRPSTGAWYIRYQNSINYGSAGDIPVPGDYNGDGITDIAVYRPSTGAWYVRNQFSAYYGSAGDIPVPADYNGDGTTEIAVFRPSTGAWYVRGMTTVYYGAAGDIPVPADYSGDGAAEIAVYRPSTGAWYIRGKSSVSYGVSTDIPVPGDYDGDGMTEIAVYRPSTGAWYVRGQASVYYGVSTDIPVPGDYNEDGATDIAVFRPSTGAWYIRGQYSAYYGSSGDIPLPEMGTGKASTAP
jgi:hypothetical protein